MFQTQHTEAQATSPATDCSYTSSAAVADNPAVSQTGAFLSRSSPFLCLADLQSVALDIKSALTAAVADLKTEIKAINSRVEHVELTAMTQGAAIHQVQ